MSMYSMSCVRVAGTAGWRRCLTTKAQEGAFWFPRPELIRARGAEALARAAERDGAPVPVCRMYHVCPPESPHGPWVSPKVVDSDKVSEAQMKAAAVWCISLFSEQCKGSGIAATYSV